MQLVDVVTDTIDRYTKAVTQKLTVNITNYSFLHTFYAILTYVTKVCYVQRTECIQFCHKDGVVYFYIVKLAYFRWSVENMQQHTTSTISRGCCIQQLI